jgi:pSer/pThr/pTyr-binding forkhead associated (FHA) protein
MARRPPKKQMKFSPYKNAGGPPSAQQPAVPPQPTGQRPLPQPVQPVAPPLQPARAPTRGLLIIVSGALAGQRVDVGAQPVTIGKGPATIQVTDDPAVSTRHAEVAVRGGAFVVTDLGSTNGTFINNARISQPTRLGDGDLLRCGNTQLKFRAE